MEICNVEQVKQILLRHSYGFQTKDSNLFQSGNQCLPKFVKRGIVRDIETEDLPTKTQLVFSCNVPGCVREFDSIQSFEGHYNSLHRYGCSVCHKNLPSAHLLDLHILESHDSFFAVQAEKKPMFSCFIPECQYKSKDPKERKDHCIQSHKFPHDFRFDKIPSKTEKMETDQIECHQLPKTFHFGHTATKSFTKPRKSILDSSTLMDDLKESLPQT